MMRPRRIVLVAFLAGWLGGLCAGLTPSWSQITTLGDALLLAGRAGGQSAAGGNAANDDLILQGTTHATRTTSYVVLQPNGGNVGIGTNTPSTTLAIDGDLGSVRGTFGNAGATPNFFLQALATIGADRDMFMVGVSGATNGLTIRWDNTLGKLVTSFSDSVVGINSTTPLATLAINGGLHVGGDADPGDNNALVDGTLTLPAIPSASGVRFLCINTTGLISSQAAACVGT